jgi:pyrroline-5-carboxylate reductase
VQLGLIGAGSMARGLALGWDRPVLCTDVVAERARALAEEVGGEAVASGVELARRADVVVLCHKPAQLSAVAAELEPHAKAVVSILAATPLADVKAAYPDRPVYRALPSTPVEVRQGAVILAADAEQDAELDAAMRAMFEELGTLVVLDDALIDVAMGLMSNAPAYYALVVEAQVDAGVRHGLTADQASRLVVQTMAGTAELLRRQAYDTLAARRAVTSPGGSTARGLDALERAGLRAAFSDALDAILKP